MLDQATYHSRSPLHKTPFGAVAAGQSVTFTLRPIRAAGFSHATLTARLEFCDDERVIVPMPWVDTDLGRDAFSCVLELGDYVGLVWYSFRLEGLDGRGQESEEYQLTVYDGTKTVAPWFGAGMSYQIFPDRFCRSRVPDAHGLVGGRTIHQSWQEEPDYRPDHRGEIRNRDFFGGDLQGVITKLPYLHSLGVETLYFCPIFEAAENHRYGTGDYSRVDPMLGTNEDFVRLCSEAHALGMRVMLDGVFNHVGFVSRYFNGDGSYGQGVGGAQSQQSPYYPWFSFQHWPDRYEGWWGFYSLPAVQEHDPTYRDFIMDGQDSVIRTWLRRGADGWRLDVADELPDDFVAALNAAAKREKPDAVVVGEVWEDGSTKVAYGVRRRHVLGGHCDGLMNYPLRLALLAWLQGGDAALFMEEMETLREHYPKDIFNSCMNALGTHDTPRILTLLGTGSDCRDQSKDWRAGYRLSGDGRARAKALLKLGFTALFAFPGSPTVYYGDEVGMEGFEDPFNRQTFPWGYEDGDLAAHVAALGNARKNYPALRRGDLHYWQAQGPVLALLRQTRGETPVLATLNAGADDAVITLPWAGCTDLLTGQRWGSTQLTLPPCTGYLLVKDEG